MLQLTWNAWYGNKISWWWVAPVRACVLNGFCLMWKAHWRWRGKLRPNIHNQYSYDSRFSRQVGRCTYTVWHLIWYWEMFLGGVQWHFFLHKFITSARKHVINLAVAPIPWLKCAHALTSHLLQPMTLFWDGFLAYNNFLTSDYFTSWPNSFLDHLQIQIEHLDMDGNSEMFHISQNTGIKNMSTLSTFVSSHRNPKRMHAIIQ